jgi:hypothetical protein
MPKILGILSLAFIIGCSSTSKHVSTPQPAKHDDTEYRVDELTTYTTHDWSYSVPKTCTEDTSSCASNNFVCEQSMMLFAVERTNLDLSAYTAQSISGFASGGAIPLDIKSGKIDGLDASLTVFTYENKPIRDYNFITLYNGKAFNFSCAALMPVKQIVINMCAKTLRSIKINKDVQVH